MVVVLLGMMVLLELSLDCDPTSQVQPFALNKPIKAANLMVKNRKRKSIRYGLHWEETKIASFPEVGSWFLWDPEVSSCFR